MSLTLSRKVWDLCHESKRYQRLARYFTADITLKELENIPDLFYCVEKKDRVLASLFSREYLPQRHQSSISFESSKFGDLAPKEVTEATGKECNFPLSLILQDQEIILDLRKRVRSQEHRSHRWYSATGPEGHEEESQVELISTDQLTSRVIELEEHPRITWVILSDCLLTNFDLKAVTELIKLLPSCRRVDLESNFFGEPDVKVKGVEVVSLMKQLLRLPQLKFLNITYNPLASIDLPEFFFSLDSQDLARLIWIPEYCLNDSAWLFLIPDPVNQEIVRQAHLSFFHPTQSVS